MGVSSDGGFQNRGQGPEDEEILIDHLGPSDRVNFPLLHLSACPSRKTCADCQEVKSQLFCPGAKSRSLPVFQRKNCKIAKQGFLLVQRNNHHDRGVCNNFVTSNCERAGRPVNGHWSFAGCGFSSS